MDIPASMTGWLIPNSSVSGVRKTGGEDGIFDDRVCVRWEVR